MCWYTVVGHKDINGITPKKSKQKGYNFMSGSRSYFHADDKKSYHQNITAPVHTPAIAETPAHWAQFHSIVSPMALLWPFDFAE